MGSVAQLTRLLPLAKAAGAPRELAAAADVARSVRPVHRKIIDPAAYQQHTEADPCRLDTVCQFHFRMSCVASQVVCMADAVARQTRAC